MTELETAAARARADMKTAENQLVLAGETAKAAGDRAKEARAGQAGGAVPALAVR